MRIQRPARPAWTANRVSTLNRSSRATVRDWYRGIGIRLHQMNLLLSSCLAVGKMVMYSDPVQWSRIRNSILCGETSIRAVARKTGISRTTIRKMLNHLVPQPYGPRKPLLPKMGPHTQTVRRLIHQDISLRPPAPLSIKRIYQHIRDEEGYCGSYGAVKDFARTALPEAGDSGYWELTYDLLISLDRARGAEFLSMLSRANPPIISKRRAQQFIRNARRLAFQAIKPSKSDQRRLEAVEWMRAVLQKDIGESADMLGIELERLADASTILKRLHDGRLSDRNRALAVLARQRGIARHTHANSSESVEVPFNGMSGTTRLEEQNDCLLEKPGPLQRSPTRP